MEVNDVSRANASGMEHAEFQGPAGLMNSGGAPCRDVVVGLLHVSLRRVPKLVGDLRVQTTCLHFPNFL